MENLVKINELKINKLMQQNERMKFLCTKKGFVFTYFEACKEVKTNLEAFEIVNSEYLELFGEKRYLSFEDFKNRQSIN